MRTLNFCLFIAFSCDKVSAAEETVDVSDLFRGPRPDFPIEETQEICMHVPVPGSCDCIDQSIKKPCDHCVGIVVHLGCDIRNELTMMKKSLLNLINQLSANEMVPGPIKLSFLYFGHEKNIQIPLTFIDDLQSFPDILIELENIVENIEPTSQANITATLEKSFELFDDFKKDPDNHSECLSKTIYFITNGHVQCGPCECTEILCPDFETSEIACWENTIKQFNEDIGRLKLKHHDINMIISTPNSKPCEDVFKSKLSCADQCKQTVPKWWENWSYNFCVDNCDFHRERFSEDCVNTTNVNNLMAWSPNNIQDGLDSWLDCDKPDESKYNYTDAIALCALPKRDCDSHPEFCLPLSLENTHTVDYFNQRGNAEFIDHLTTVAKPCPMQIQNECNCHYEITVASVPQAPRHGCCGPRGNPGPNGMPGPEGACGPCGPAGPCGDNGPCGSRGQPGLSGPPGKMGPEGLRGPAGAPGRAGNLGREGNPGRDASHGKGGSTGPRGIQGKSGSAGLVGLPGNSGLSGSSGPTGPEGPCGEPGMAGVGIEQRNYYDEYKKKLRQLIISDIAKNGDQSVLYKKLVKHIRSEYGSTCSCGCNLEKNSYGQCLTPPVRYANPVQSQCPNKDYGYPLPAPSYKSTTRRTTAATRPPTTIRTTIKQTTKAPRPSESTRPSEPKVESIRVLKPKGDRQIYWNKFRSNRRSRENNMFRNDQPIPRSGEKQMGKVVIVTRRNKNKNRRHRH